MPSVGSTSPDPVSRKLYSLRKVPSRKKSLLQRICEVAPESSNKLWGRWGLWDGFAIQISGVSWVLFPEHSLIIQTICGFEASWPPSSQTLSKWPTLPHVLHLESIYLHVPG